MNKSCIFHIPNKIDEDVNSGSQIRPIKMICAFENIGYEVDVVMGYGKERKKQIQKIKQNIKNGKKYDFLYSESSTMPTLLTESHHLPTYPFLDFGFFKFCKTNGLKIGLFYRDLYWAFPIYKKKVTKLKRMAAISLYKYDLKQYKRNLDVLYLPTKQIYNYLPFIFEGEIEELPPAIDQNQFINKNKVSSDNTKLNLFYVGGIGDLYNIEFIFRSAKELKFINLTICCREQEWEEEKHRYERYLNPRIEVVHKSGSELSRYYENADILCLFIEPDEYRNFAMPIKFFEYMGSGKPIIATNCSAADKFIKDHNIGWNLEYSYDKLVSRLEHIYNNPQEIIEKSKNINNIRDDNTWEARARKVVSQLSRQ